MNGEEANPFALMEVDQPTAGVTQGRSPQLRETFPGSAGTTLGNVQVADELGFAYLDGDIDFGAVGRNEIFQNIKFIILTEYFSVPLDREFGMDYSMVDKPMHIAEAVLSQEVAMKITMYEPRAQFRQIDFLREELIGKLSPSVKVTLLSTARAISTVPVPSGPTTVGGAPGKVIEEMDLPKFYEMLIALARVPGPTGPEGEQGEAATITAGTTTTGEPGTDANVTNVGDEYAAVFDFLIPRGEKGETGQGITIEGTVPDSGSLPTTGNDVGDIWIDQSTGDGWSWDGDSWNNIGPIQGPAGAAGPAGADGAAGPAGPPGQIWRGEYSPATTYQPNDAVSYDGSSFICTGTTTGVAPVPDTISWMIPPLANTGSKGSIAALPASNQTQYYARGDNTWQLAPSRLARGSIWGLTLSNNVTDATNDIDVAVGQCADSLGSTDIVLASAITKRLDAAWAVGINQGGRDTGAIADAWWHMFVIKNPTTGEVDALFSLSPTAPTLPGGYTVFRRVGSLLRVAAALLNFAQLGDTFLIPSVSVYSSTTARSFAAFTMTRCPLGIITFPIMKVQVVSNAAAVVFFTFGQGMDATIQIANTPQVNNTNNVDTVVLTEISTNFSQQIYFTLVGTTIAAGLINQHGYIDNRGKDGYSP